MKLYRRPRFNSWVRKIPWRRKWQLTSVFLPGEFHGQRDLAGYSPWGHKSRTWFRDLTTTSQRLPGTHIQWSKWVCHLVRIYTMENCEASQQKKGAEQTYSRLWALVEWLGGGSKESVVQSGLGAIRKQSRPVIEYLSQFYQGWGTD